MGIIEITGAGGDSNTYVIKDEKIVVIDPGNGENISRIENILKDHSLDINDVDILINTHHHYDHIGGNKEFINRSNCDLMASKATAELLRKGDNEKTLASKFGADMSSFKVARDLEDGDLIKIGDSELKVISTPGHTNGDICLYEPDEMLLFSGDTVFKSGIGRMDLPTAQPDVMKDSIEKLLKLDVEKIYPGHGPKIDRDAQIYLERALNMVDNVY